MIMNEGVSWCSSSFAHRSFMHPRHSTVGFSDIEAAAHRLKGVARVTPVITSSTVDQDWSTTAHFKCECLQRTGAFKFRGAYNALSQLSADSRRDGRPDLLVWQPRSSDGARWPTAGHSRPRHHAVRRAGGQTGCDRGLWRDRHPLPQRRGFARGTGERDVVAPRHSDHPTIRPRSYCGRPGHRPFGSC